MEREKLLEEYKMLLDVLVEKIKFMYSKDYYELTEFEKQKINNDKVATEGHLSALCERLWSDKLAPASSLGNMFAIGLLSSMFSGGGFGSSSSSMDYLKKELDKAPIVEEVEKPSE